MVVTKPLTWASIVLVHAAVIVFVPLLVLLATGRPLTGELDALRLSGAAPLLVGGLTLLWAGWGLTSAGQGTPAPFDPPRVLVIRGPYRLVRNPMYLGDLLVLLGESLLFGAAGLLAYTLVMLAIFHLFVVLYEEPNLRRRFGAAYERYREGVPRWVPVRSARNRLLP